MGRFKRLEMGHNSACFIEGRLIKVGDLVVDLSSLEKGFQLEEKSRQDIWDYIQYREGLLKWPSNREEARKNG